jgi:hypothetical protein
MMGQYEEDVEDEDDDEEDLEEAKSRRQKRLDNKKAHSSRKGREIIPPKYRMEKQKRKAYRPKILWDEHDEYYEYEEY